jgi:hypothetical protein
MTENSDENKTYTSISLIKRANAAFFVYDVYIVIQMMNLILQS